MVTVNVVGDTHMEYLTKDLQGLFDMLAWDFKVEAQVEPSFQWYCSDHLAR